LITSCDAFLQWTHSLPAAAIPEEDLPLNHLEERFSFIRRQSEAGITGCDASFRCAAFDLAALAGTHVNRALLQFKTAFAHKAETGLLPKTDQQASWILDLTDSASGSADLATESNLVSYRHPPRASIGLLNGNRSHAHDPSAPPSVVKAHGGEEGPKKKQ
jgi:hypothetical protein